MKSNHKFLIVFALATLAFIYVILFVFEGIDMIIQFNTSADGISTLSKYLVVLVVLAISGFVGFQLYDEKNQNDYMRWYISSVVVIGVDIWMLVTNL